MMRVLRAADRIEQPWKNGGGVTREIAVSPDGADFETFDWRVSIAEVTAAGPFSRFDGIDRTLAILDGKMRLSFPDHVLELDADSAPLAFPGEAACEGTPLGGPVTDLNLMTRRGKVRGRMECVSGTVETRGPALIVARTTTQIHIANQSQNLDRLDALLLDETITISLAGMAFVLRMD